MLPFEPRTDRKELEIPGLDPSSTLASRSATPEAADLTIRILRQDATSGAAALTWTSESVLVYLIADLVRASRGRTAVEMPAALAAHFDNSLEALVAAGRIQTAILEFLACRPGDGMGAAVLLHPAAGFSQKMAQSALRLAEPGQIIVSQEVASEFRSLSGIELRRVPALMTGGTEHAGLSELIWTSAERLQPHSYLPRKPATELPQWRQWYLQPSGPFSRLSHLPLFGRAVALPRRLTREGPPVRPDSRKPDDCAGHLCALAPQPAQDSRGASNISFRAWRERHMTFPLSSSHGICHLSFFAV